MWQIRKPKDQISPEEVAERTEEERRLVTTEGKKKLKEAIAAAVAKVLKKQKVVDVLFSEFVVQF